MKYCGRHCPILPPEGHVGPGTGGIIVQPLVLQEEKVDEEDVHPGKGVPDPEDYIEQFVCGTRGGAAGDAPLPLEVQEEACCADITAWIIGIIHDP